jgi:hypothetical protein
MFSPEGAGGMRRAVLMEKAAASTLLNAGNTPSTRTSTVCPLTWTGSVSDSVHSEKTDWVVRVRGGTEQVCCCAR